jgi:hypothetical protein
MRITTFVRAVMSLFAERGSRRTRPAPAPTDEVNDRLLRWVYRAPPLTGAAEPASTAPPTDRAPEVTAAELPRDSLGERMQRAPPQIVPLTHPAPPKAILEVMQDQQRRRRLARFQVLARFFLKAGVSYVICWIPYGVVVPLVPGLAWLDMLGLILAATVAALCRIWAHGFGWRVWLVALVLFFIGLRFGIPFGVQWAITPRGQIPTPEVQFFTSHLITPLTLLTDVWIATWLVTLFSSLRTPLPERDPQRPWWHFWA